MEITEVRIKLMDDPQERLQAFCSITFDACFVIRDLKIIEGAKGSFVAMPSRKLTDRCPKCHSKNHLRSLFCNQCGAKLSEDRAPRDDEGRAKLYADIAHPINSRCREMIQARVIKAYEEEVVKAQQPGYVCTYDDYGEDSYAQLSDDHEPEPELAPCPQGYVGPADSVHRVDGHVPAAGAPHHKTLHVRSPAAVPGRPARSGGPLDEGFGTGIL